METQVKNYYIVVNEASVKNYNMDGEFQLSPKVTRRVGKSDVNANEYIIEMICEIRNTAQNPFPIDLTASVSGIFTLESESEDAIDNFLKLQGVQMVFPYLRTLVSNITSIAMMPTILLPVIDVTDFVDGTPADN